MKKILCSECRYYRSDGKCKHKTSWDEVMNNYYDCGSMRFFSLMCGEKGKLFKPKKKAKK